MRGKGKPFARWCRWDGLGGFWWFETGDHFYILQTDEEAPAWVALPRFDIPPGPPGRRIYDDWGGELGSVVQ